MAKKVGNDIVSAKRLGGILGVGERWVRQLENQGYIVKTSYGKYALDASVQGYIRFIRESEVKTAVDAATSREQFEAERARKLKLENDTRESFLIETPEVLAAIDHIFGQVRTALAAIAPRITEDVSARRKIDDAIDNVLTALADRLEQAVAALQKGSDPLAADAAHDA